MTTLAGLGVGHFFLFSNKHFLVSYEIYETRQSLVSLISYEMATHIRSSIYGTSPSLLS